MIKIIPTRIHGILDYVVALVVIGLPYLFDAWGAGGAKIWVPMLLGGGTIVYSLLTDYELGLVRVIPMPVHLGLDVLSGLFLAASPFLFGFNSSIWAPYVVVGVLEIGTGLLTSPRAGVVAPAHG